MKAATEVGNGDGFHPRDRHLSGTAGSFDQARADFEAAWRAYLPTCIDADFDAWHYQQAATAWKYRMWDTGCRMPTQTVDDRSRCFCGVEISTASIGDHIIARHMEVRG